MNFYDLETSPHRHVSHYRLITTETGERADHGGSWTATRGGTDTKSLGCRSHGGLSLHMAYEVLLALLGCVGAVSPRKSHEVPYHLLPRPLVGDCGRLCITISGDVPRPAPAVVCMTLTFRF